MAVSLTLHEEHARKLGEQLFAVAGVEGAAFVLCGVAVDNGEVRLLGRRVVPIEPSLYRRRTATGLTLGSETYTPVIKQARNERMALLLAHSHPVGPLAFSVQDDHEERRLFEAVHRRVPGLPHGSLVFTSPDQVVGRTWAEGGANVPIDRVSIAGSRLRLLGPPGASPPPFMDRQVRAFGPDVLATLRQLRVGVVGAGGTGSAIIEQLLRIGVGRLLAIDHDRFEVTDVNRGYGTRLADEGLAKVEISKRTVQLSGLPTEIEAVRGSILHASTARRLRMCDVVFGCTDQELPRLILGRLSVRYLIPVLDMGVLIDSDQGLLRGIHGRITRLAPGTACLLCRQRISPTRLRAESLPPEERRRLAAEGYAPELDTPEPAVIAFTTAVASYAVGEFLHMLTGFMGERATSEIILRFDPPQVHGNAEPPEPDCECGEGMWGRGDESPFLGLSWAPEP